jgi:hypothetical protein
LSKQHGTIGAISGVTAFVIASAIGLCACSRGTGDARKRIVPEYDENTGKLRLLKYDANGNGTVDTWSYMDGARIKRIEIDNNEDGKIDRWEYYKADQKLEKVGFSRASDGIEDAWSYSATDGSIDRIDVSTRRDGRVTRIEHYAHGRLTAAEEDGDGDGSTDKWETYDGDRLASVAFDTTHRGTPDRRLTYGAAGTARMEVDARGDGRFVVADASSVARPPK